MAAPPIQYVLFDLDGTLIDHFRTIYRCYCHALEAMGLEPASYEKVRATVGGGIRVTFSRLVGPEYVDRGVELWMKKFEEIWSEGIEVLPGATELLEQLHSRGVRSAIFTNKEGDRARQIAGHTGMETWLDAVVGRLDTEWAKPAPEFTRYALDQLEAVPEATVMVGDSPFDVAAGRAGALRCYVVATGSHSAEQLRDETDADGVYSGLPELAADVFGIELTSAH